MQAPSEPRPSGGRPFNRTAKLHPYRRHHRQTASLPPPHERACGQAGEATGDPRSTGMQATSERFCPSQMHCDANGASYVSRFSYQNCNLLQSFS